MTESHIRRSAEIIPFPSRHRDAGHANVTRALELEAARLRSIVDTTGWYHDEAITEDCRQPRQPSWFSWRDRH